MVYRFKAVVKNKSVLGVDEFKVRGGFTIIELLIVISILAIVATLVTTSYLGFERRERVKNAAVSLKNDIRFTQNKALSGYKGIATGSEEVCESVKNEVLIGWYTTVDKANNNYKITGSCLTLTGEKIFNQISYKLPKDVKIENIDYNFEFGVESKDSVNILFRPLLNDARFFDTDLSPPFLTQAGSIDKTKLLGGSEDQGSITVKISAFGSKWEVVILQSGEVNERQL